jgi:hypothetical protein
MLLEPEDLMTIHHEGCIFLIINQGLSKNMKSMKDSLTQEEQFYIYKSEFILN